MLKRRLLDGVKLERLAEEYDLSWKQTQTIIDTGFKKISQHIKTE